MNDWYIDRSKNFINDSLEPVLRFIEKYKGDTKSSALIIALTEGNIFKEDDGNPHAALTRFRDHGLINNDNLIGDSARDYLQGDISINELIIDLFLKRPIVKKNAPNLKPFILMCNVFNIMFEVSASLDDIYLTFFECLHYLYKLNSIDDLSIELVDTIINDRKYFATQNRLNLYTNIKPNDITNLSIWFNALKHTSLFVPTEDRTILKPNVFQQDFFKFIAINGYKLSETPTKSNAILYKYYCAGNTGLSEIIPNMFKPNIIFRDDEEIGIITNYIFGLKKEPDFDFTYYFTKECFGIYHPFVTIPGLVIRVIRNSNISLGNKLHDFCKKGIYR